MGNEIMEETKMIRIQLQDEEKDRREDEEKEERG